MPGFIPALAGTLLPPLIAVKVGFFAGFLASASENFAAIFGLSLELILAAGFEAAFAVLLAGLFFLFFVLLLAIAPRPQLNSPVLSVHVSALRRNARTDVIRPLRSGLYDAMAAFHAAFMAAS
ncbi:MAG: hypothetical protein JO254_12095 [Pseudolabrys sp.]|nr:hypothetical protein [Pseudolabrys sp.]